MKNYFLANLLLLLFSLMLTIDLTNQDVNIEKLINDMSIEDKCGQMTQIAFKAIEKLIKPIDPDENPIEIFKLRHAILTKKVGSILDTPYDVAQKSSTWQKIINAIQSVALKDTKLKIPVLYGIDSIHGANYIREATLFPQPLATASSFNSEIAFKIGEITALETRAVGIPWNFNPVLDVGRQLLWPRLYETYGEDVYVVSQMGQAYIKGHQGEDLKNRTKTATCLKHYIGYSFPINGKDRTSAFIPDNILREYFLPSFQHGVEAGSLTVMIDSTEVNGLPCHANSYYINDILKGELNFPGFVVSDWQDIINLHSRDKIAENEQEAVRLAVMAGVDMSMVPFDFSFHDYCVNLSKIDQKFLNRVNNSVNRILNVKKTLGLFDSAYPFEKDLAKIGTKESEDFNLEAAKETIILAKNENNLLPLDMNKLKNHKILVTGPTGNLIKVLNGGWSYTWQGENEQHFEKFGRKKYTIFESIKLNHHNVEYSQGADFDKLVNLEHTIELAKKSELIILCIGENTYAESLGNIENFFISDSQTKLANELFNLKKNIILIYIGGRPRIITDLVHKSNSVLISFLPGNRGAEAISDILFGKYNPNAKMPISYPLNPNGISTYDHKPLEDFDVNKVNFLFPFGHGLSYTRFAYLSIKLNTTILTLNDYLSIKIVIKNIGSLTGKEIVILYLNDEYASVTRPVRQVKRFSKISLNANQTTEIEFVLNKNDLSFINYQSKRVVEPGRFNIYVANLTATFLLK